MNNFLKLVLIFTIFYFIWLYSKKELFSQDENSRFSEPVMPPMPAEWMEFNHGNLSYLNYPPCYQISFESRNLYDLLESRQLVDKYKNLLETISIVLCQEKFNNENVCYNNIIVRRINDLEKVGYKNKDNKKYLPKLKIILGDSYKKIRIDTAEFLLRAITIIENQIIELLNEQLTSQEKNDVMNNINIFYSTHFPVIVMRC